jgi:hypothetical protein
MSSKGQWHTKDAYEYNTRNWSIGDLVIHRADAKTKKMLMVVVGWKDDLVKTAYIKDGKPNWLNDKKFLLDPKKFGLPTTKEEYTDEKP